MAFGSRLCRFFLHRLGGLLGRLASSGCHHLAVFGEQIRVFLIHRTLNEGFGEGRLTAAFRCFLLQPAEESIDILTGIRSELELLVNDVAVGLEPFFSVCHRTVGFR